MAELHVVTGASRFSGKYITRRLLAAGIDVRSLTRHPTLPTEFGERVSLAAFDFDRPGRRAESLRGATTHYPDHLLRRIALAIDRGTHPLLAAT